MLAELKIEKGNLVECAAKGLGEAQDLESDACGRRAERLDKHRVVLLAGLAKATKRFEAQPLVDRSGGGPRSREVFVFRFCFLFVAAKKKYR